MRSVATLYYRPRELNQNATGVIASAEYDVLQYPTLDTLLSPLRRPHVLGESPALLKNSVFVIASHLNATLVLSSV